MGLLLSVALGLLLCVAGAEVVCDAGEALGLLACVAGAEVVEAGGQAAPPTACQPSVVAFQPAVLARPSLMEVGFFCRQGWVVGGGQWEEQSEGLCVR